MNSFQWLVVPPLVVGALGVVCALAAYRLRLVSVSTAANALLFGGLLCLVSSLLIILGGLLL